VVIDYPKRTFDPAMNAVSPMIQAEIKVEGPQAGTVAAEDTSPAADKVE
jgi:hypothetical protein